MSFRSKVPDVGTTAPTDPRIDDLWTDTSTLVPVLKIYTGEDWIIISGTSEGAPGPAGPPGGALLTGYWRYNPSTTAPPTAGQFRTNVEVGNVGE